MIKKTYKTFRLKKLYKYVDVDGKSVEIVFKGGLQIDSTSKYTTSNEAIQKALEENRGFGREYYLESVEEKNEKPAPAPEKKPVKKAEEKAPLTDVKDIKRFHNIVEMRNYMAELGFAGVENMNYQEAKAAAQKEGYDFKIQRDK